VGRTISTVAMTRAARSQGGATPVDFGGSALADGERKRQTGRAERGLPHLLRQVQILRRAPTIPLLRRAPTMTRPPALNAGERTPSYQALAI